MTSIWLALWLSVPWYSCTPKQHTGVFLSSASAQAYLDEKRIVHYTVFKISSEKWERELVKQGKGGKRGRQELE